MECIASDMVLFTVDAPVFFVDTRNPSSTKRLYVDPDGQSSINCTRKKILKIE